MSTFAIHQTELLLQRILLNPEQSGPPFSVTNTSSTYSTGTQRLHSLLAKFHSPISASLVQETIDALKCDGHGLVADGVDEEAKASRKAAIGAVAASIYGRILDMMLQQATEADAEASCLIGGPNWSVPGGSWSGISLQGSKALPLRLKHVLETVIHTLRARNLAITPSAFTPNSIRQLFPSSLQPSRLAISFFPHLSRHPRVFFRSPFELTRQECQSYRQALQNIRDDRAERLGRLAASRQASLIDTQVLVNFIGTLKRSVTDTEPLDSPDQEYALVELLSDINSNILPRTSHLFSVGISALRRPSRLMLVWPRLVVIPPITFILFRFVYGSRRTLMDQLAQAVDTLSGFWTNYLIQPFKDILDTVRTGGEEGVRIVSQEGVKADMESLERMAVALSQDKYHFSPPQLEILSMQIRRGDLTPVLKVYEEDLKSPLKSMVAGSLIRSLLIQVQKMKVDVDVALSGIDKLLRSQELTFAFVGVAPALAVVYVVFGWMKNVWQSGQGRGKYGGRGRRQSIWLAMRRIERLLVLSSSSQKADSESLSSLDQGLILLSVAQLRAYGEKYLPVRSRLREEFLVDVSDLEDTNLARREKMDVVNRMWRSWADVLEWSSIGGK